MLRVVTGMAEGTDRIGAGVGRDLDYELQAVLPFERADFERDFETAESQAEFQQLLADCSAVLQLDGSRATPASDDLAYQAAGQIMLRQADIILAVWDGAPPRGLGGTGVHRRRG